MAGSFVGANLGLVYLFGLLQVLPEKIDANLARIGLRVVVAWIAAVAMLILALQFAA